MESPSEFTVGLLVIGVLLLILGGVITAEHEGGKASMSSQALMVIGAIYLVGSGVSWYYKLEIRKKGL
jgi:prepilin signal peptidase PulO-like enzyme (type II secretory pathway)